MAFDRITASPDLLEGRPTLRGLRISVGTVVRLVAADWTFDEILAEYPALQRQDLTQALQYAATATDVHHCPLRDRNETRTSPVPTGEGSRGPRRRRGGPAREATSAGGSSGYGARVRVPTAVITAGSLVGGWQAARRTGVRPLGGVVLAAGGVLAGRDWARRTGPATTGALTATYLGAFALSHPLARRIGAWPSVLVVSAITAAASYVAADRRPVRD